MKDFGNIKMKFRNEFWLSLFREYIIPNLFAVHGNFGLSHSGSWDHWVRCSRAQKLTVDEIEKANKISE